MFLPLDDDYTRGIDELVVAMDQYMEIITSQDAWLIADDSGEGDEETTIDRDLKPTNSARQVKALVEQVTGASVLLPVHTFLTAVQIAIHPFHSSYNEPASSSPSNCLCSNPIMHGSLRHLTPSRRFPRP